MKYNLLRYLKRRIFRLKIQLELFFSKLRGVIYFGTNKVNISKHVSIPFPLTTIPEGFAEIKSFVRLNSSLHNKIIIGNNVTICRFTTIETAGGDIIIGNNIIIGEYCTIQGQGGVEIGDNVLFASHVHLITNHHKYTDVETPIKYQENISKRIIIKKNSWIGINVTILSGVTIGEHSIVGTGSVVKSDVPDYCVVAGNPAIVIRKYDFSQEKWVNVN